MNGYNNDCYLRKLDELVKRIRNPKPGQKTLGFEDFYNALPHNADQLLSIATEIEISLPSWRLQRAQQLHRI